MKSTKKTEAKAQKKTASATTVSAKSNMDQDESKSSDLAEDRQDIDIPGRNPPPPPKKRRVRTKPS